MKVIVKSFLFIVICPILVTSSHKFSRHRAAILAKQEASKLDSIFKKVFLWLKGVNSERLLN